MRTPVLILHAPGSNRDREAALACHLAGGQPDIVQMSAVLKRKHLLDAYHMLVIPGGFSYGDDLGAGKLWSLDLRHALGPSLSRFMHSGRPILGICNGFQVLVKAGLLPGLSRDASPGQGGQSLTLAPNDSAQFECRWVHLEANAQSPCIFTQDLESELIQCPVAHGEGKVVAPVATLSHLHAHHLVALRYRNAQGGPAAYPDNPNGSVDDIAGLTNPQGNILGLMPHPEDHISPLQHPQYRHNGGGGLGLQLFRNGIKYAASL